MGHGAIRNQNTPQTPLELESYIVGYLLWRESQSILVQCDFEFPSLARDLGLTLDENLHISSQIAQARIYLDTRLGTVNAYDQEAIDARFAPRVDF